MSRVLLICAARTKSKGKKKNERPSRDETAMGMNPDLIEFQNLDEVEGSELEEGDRSESDSGRVFFIDGQECRRNQRLLLVDISEWIIVSFC